MSLTQYRKMRDFSKTREPRGGKSSKKAPIFVVQEHWASHHHFDFRLEAFGTLKSWAVPKGPSTTPGDKRLAVEVEDHPIDYARFSGKIPEGEYGAGNVEIWDHGSWVPPKDLKTALAKGRLDFELKGDKLQGLWTLVRTRRATGRKSQWLLIKRHDAKAAPALKTVGVKAARAPKELPFELATLVDHVPSGGEWIHEVKWDGYRTQVRKERAKVRLLTRNGLDWTKKYEPLAKEFKKIKSQDAILDGEIVALDENGHSSFSKLQQALKESDFRHVVFYAFDLLFLNGRDLRGETLETRKRFLKDLLSEARSPQLRFSEHWRAQGEELFQFACEKGLEGIVSKKREAPYRGGRGLDWVKIKCSNRQEFVIGGYTEPEGQREAFGALLMGFHDKNGELRYAGRVGTGYDASDLRGLIRKLKDLEVETSPFAVQSPKSSKKIHWVQPELIAEVQFRGWTRDLILRQASFVGLREDKDPDEISLERHLKVPEVKEVKKSGPRDFRITHPKRMIYPKAQVTKMDVAGYYRSVAPWLMKAAKNRPLSFLRCPEEAGGSCFYQKHIHSSSFTEVYEDKIKDQKIVYIDSERGLLELVQWGVLELHAWQCHIEHSMHPDQVIFDLDPDEKVAWPVVREAALRVRDLLKDLGLVSFLKTTGGKGLHIHVPIAPRYSWEQVRDFAKAVAKQLESENPKLYIANMSKKKRVGKIFIDYLRNGFGSTAIAPYSLRAKDKPYVAVPVAWRELTKLPNARFFTLDTTLKRLSQLREDPWPKYFHLKQRVSLLEKREPKKVKKSNRAGVKSR